MKKDFTRDYTTEIFRKYAAANMRTYEQERQRIYNSVLEKYLAQGGEMAVMQAETAVADSYAYLMDIAAADGTFEILKAGGQENIVKAVKAVYCVYPNVPIRRGDITDRAYRLAASLPTDVSNVYRWLKKARLLCALIRGLSISEKDRDIAEKYYSKVASSGLYLDDIIKL